jgi:hypothetical protein
MIKCGWRFGEIERHSLLKYPDGRAKITENWYGIAARTNMSMEKFKLSIVEIETLIHDYVETKLRKPELHIHFTVEISEK